uniref:Multidrug resistance-associated protein 1-like n=1 Tax=Crassostrea virginica TaxID=6565 RepID=A0A8B8CL74_CRAVI|nr:multidrug resistance-associated protein 1-like [Crassostrea virginica]
MAKERGDMFCDGVFWDANQTWYTEEPDFTSCFQKTVLLWMPCAFLIVFAPIRVYLLHQEDSSSLRLSKLNIAKTVLAIWVAVVCVLEVGKSVYFLDAGSVVPAVDFISPLVLLLTMVLCIVLLQYERRRGVYSSGFLLVFWLLLAVAGVFIFQSKLRKAMKTGIADLMAFTTFHLFFAAVLIELILSAFVDGGHFSHDEKRCPEEVSSFLSKITFWWFTRMVIKGYKHSLVVEDLWHLQNEDSCAVVVSHFTKHWKKEIHRRNVKQQRVNVPERLSTGEVVEIQTFTGDTGEEFGNESETKISAKLLRVLVRAYLPSFLFTAFLKLIYDVMQFISPLLLKLIILFIENKTEYSWRGMFYSVLMFVLAMLQSLILHQYFHGCQLLGMKIRTSLTCLVYRKMLILSNAAKRESTTGEIVNLMSVDAQRFMDLMTYVHTVWSGPLQIIVALYFLYMELGPSIFAGFGLMVILIPFNAWIAQKTRDLQVKQMNLKDARIKLMNEVLNGIKVLKLYAWEESFEEKIHEVRRKEMRVLRTMAYLNAFLSFTWTTAPVLVSLITFAVFVLSDPSHILNAEKAFVSLALFNLLRFPMSMLPQVISNIVQTSVSLNRLQKFLNNKELDEDAVIKKEDCKYAVMISNGTFTWDKTCQSATTLRQITLNIPEGSLVAIVGPVGSGKSSFLSAILGEMEKIHGEVTVRGSLAFVTQQAWIQNLTLRDNILFGKAKCDAEYEQVLEDCALLADLEILPAGDMTEIGEKGINLSGGQKQRVSLARAVYQDADVYLLDDPLSAVDAHVGKHIFEKVIGYKGILHNKTRILVTHGLGYLPFVDLIVVMNDGEVTEVGTFKELMGHAGSFAEYVRNYLCQKLEDDETILTDDVLDEDMISIQLTDCTSTENVRSTESLYDVQENARSTPQRVSESSNVIESLDHMKSSEKIHSEEIPKESDKLLQKNEMQSDQKQIQEEKMETGSVKFAVFWIYVKSVGVILSLVTVFFFVLYNGASVYTNVWLSEWSNDRPIIRNGTNGTLVKEVDISKRNMRLWMYGVLGLLQGLFTIIASLALYIGNIHAGKALHARLINNVLASPMMFFDTTPIGRILNRFSKDIDVIDTQIGRTYESWLSCLLRVISVPIVIGYSTPYFLIVFIPLAVLYIAVQRFYVATSRQLKRLESTLKSPIYSHFGESISGVATIRAFGQQQRFISDSERKVDENNQSYFPSIIANRWLAVRLEFVGNSVVFFACLFAVLGRDTLTGGIVGLSVSYALNITQTLNWLVRMTTELETNIVAVERVKEYSEISREAPMKIDATKPEDTWPKKGEIVFDKYCVRYREGLDFVLKDITCKIHPSEKIGIVGRTGAGKSTLLLGLFRIIESAKGQIRIDGVDISKLGLYDLRSKLPLYPRSFVSNEPVLFSGSLRMNLDPFNAHSDNTVWTALEHAHLKVFVESLPDKLYHDCSEGGENLSVGQRQLICLARALLRKTKILILDEATAAVDMETDEYIQKTIRREFASCTILTIAHRLNTVMDSNRVMVLSSGSITEFDNPQKLLNDENSVFYKMAKDANLV